MYNVYHNFKLCFLKVHYYLGPLQLKTNLWRLDTVMGPVNTPDYIGKDSNKIKTVVIEDIWVMEVDMSASAPKASVTL